MSAVLVVVVNKPSTRALTGPPASSVKALCMASWNLTPLPLPSPAAAMGWRRQQGSDGNGSSGIGAAGRALGRRQQHQGSHFYGSHCFGLGQVGGPLPPPPPLPSPHTANAAAAITVAILGGHSQWPGAGRGAIPQPHCPPCTIIAAHAIAVAIFSR